MLKDLNKAQSLLFSFFIYLGIMPFAYMLTMKCLDLYFPIEFGSTILLYDFVLTNIIFVLSVIIGNCSLIDFYWTLLPICELYYTFYLKANYSQSQGFLFSKKFMLVAIIMSLWGLRLTYNYIRSWPGFTFVDFRIKELLEKLPFQNPVFKWFVLYFEYFIFPGLFLFLAKNSVLHFALYSESTKISALNLLGFLIMFLAVIYQTTADKQLYCHRNSPESKEILDRGLWYYSRHPNYFGELLFWTGGFLLALELVYDRNVFLYFVSGPFSMFVLFRFMTGPWMDSHLARKRPEYKEYMKKNRSLLLPWPRKEENNKKDL